MSEEKFPVLVKMMAYRGAVMLDFNPAILTWGIETDSPRIIEPRVVHKRPLPEEAPGLEWDEGVRDESKTLAPIVHEAVVLKKAPFEGKHSRAILVKVRLDGKQHIVAMTGRNIPTNEQEEKNKIKLEEFYLLGSSLDVLKEYLANRGHIDDFRDPKYSGITLANPIEAEVINGMVVLNGEEIRKTIQHEFAKHRAIAYVKALPKEFGKTIRLESTKQIEFIKQSAEQLELAYKEVMEAKVEQELLNGDFTIEHIIVKPQLKWVPNNDWIPAENNPDYMKVSIKPKTQITLYLNKCDTQHFIGTRNKDGDYIIDIACSENHILGRVTRIDPPVTFKNVIINGKLDPDKLREATATDGTTTFKQLVVTHRPMQLKMGMLEREAEEIPEADMHPDGGHKPMEGLPNQKAPSPPMKKMGAR